MLKMGLKNKINISKTGKGFSLIEVMISLLLVATILAVVFTMTMGGIANGKKTQSIADLRTLSLQKVSELSNNLTNELEKFPNGEVRVGSINPDSPINGYFDELNEQGCVIRRSSIFQPPIDVPTKEAKEAGAETGSSSNGKDNGTTKDGGIRGGQLGDLGNGETGTTIDCSKSTYPTTIANQSMNAVYRRQWTIAKNQPNKGDSTILVIIVDKKTDQIVRSEILVKVDGVARK